MFKPELCLELITLNRAPDRLDPDEGPCRVRFHHLRCDHRFQRQQRRPGVELVQDDAERHLRQRPVTKLLRRPRQPQAQDNY